MCSFDSMSLIAPAVYDRLSKSPSVEINCREGKTGIDSQYCQILNHLQVISLFHVNICAQR